MKKMRVLTEKECVKNPHVKIIKVKLDDGEIIDTHYHSAEEMHLDIESKGRKVVTWWEQY